MATIALVARPFEISLAISKGVVLCCTHAHNSQCPADNISSEGIRNLTRGRSTLMPCFTVPSGNVILMGSLGSLALSASFLSLIFWNSARRSAWKAGLPPGVRSVHFGVAGTRHSDWTDISAHPTQSILQRVLSSNRTTARSIFPTALLNKSNRQ